MWHGGTWWHSSLALMVWSLWCPEDWEEKDDCLTEWTKKWMNQSISYEAVCWTAPATPGLLLFQIITLFTPAFASIDLTAISTAFWPTSVAIFLPLAHNSNPLVYFWWTSAFATLAGAAVSIYLVIPSTPELFDLVCIGSICKTFYFPIIFIVCLHISTNHFHMIFTVLYTLLALYRMDEIRFGALVPFTCLRF